MYVYLHINHTSSDTEEPFPMKIKNKDNIEVFCKYCERATPLATEGKLVCAKRGVVAEDYKCRSFIYDPLKRAPKLFSLDTDNAEMTAIDE